MTSDNIYSAPAADLKDGPRLLGEDAAAELKFYVVAPRKFILLYVCTLGFYKLYWFYKNCSSYKAHSNDSMWPVVRAFFSIFFVHSLFRRVDETIKERSPGYSWNPQALATSFVIFQLVNNIIDRLPKTDFDNIEIGIELVVMLPVMGSILYAAQRAINVACGDPDGERNSTLSVANWLWIVIGGSCLVLAIVGLIYDVK